MTIGIRLLRQNEARSSDLYSLEMCFTVETVDWTKKTSAPASCAMAANRSAFCGMDETRDDAAALAQFLHAPGDEFFLDRLEIKFLDLLGHRAFVGLGDLRQRILGIVVAGLHALEIDHAETAQPGHFVAEADVRHAVHGAGDDGDLEPQRLLAAGPGDDERGVDLVRVDGDFARHERDLVEPVGDARLAITSDPHSHNSYSFWPS